mmetsp:Transcript_4821/g.12389  ORF Transcript_4821/g.12389 Transcript_4821/m.12389 type:complete len:513 (-) Transcript_4821:242-1780(-)|eukprot:CAMPEP_0197185130 /NCGR_PEP_ID=MMETSP1423-20130617/11208_1 /TAXON_ID=476441 /ORGANISM="Pseudo-nitzschia heimii, Strain UNC1101" /LENGTH=512 /DNA_ID=CAMNT_0042636103 /DNA_START=246 /DNA_END=1784 /DNA_ORIENTATION=+
MTPLFRSSTATAATLALAVALSDGSSSSSSVVVAAAATDDRPQQLQNVDTQLHRRTNQYFGIGARPGRKKRNSIEGYLDEPYVPPWRDPVTTSPTSSPTSSPTTAVPTPRPTAIPSKTPTNFPTRTPTNAPVEDPTAAPVPIGNASAPVETIVSDSGAVFNAAFDEESGERETSCALMPSIGTFVSQVLEIEYFLYVDDEEYVTAEGDALQKIIDSTIDPQLHDALVDAGMSCEGADYVTANYVMVNLTSGGNSMIGAQCLVDETDGLLANATACYQVWSQMEATMWFAPARRQRQLQAATTPFGDREAFNQFTVWTKDAFESLEGSESGDGIRFVEASFRGFVNVNDFDGTTHEESFGVGTDITSAFMGTAYSVDDRGFNLVYALIAVIAGVMIFAFVIFFVIVRRKRNQRAFMEHAMCVEELELDSKDDLNDTADVVDDDSLFREGRPLPEDLKVKLESADHDYRWVGEERKNPIFVATERNVEFRDHLSVLQRRKEEEERLRQYESVML